MQRNRAQHEYRRSIALKDRAFRYRICTPAYAEAIGASAAPELVNRSDFELLARPAARRLRAIDESVAQTGLPSVVEASLLPGGNSGWHLVVRPIRNSQQKLAGLESRIVTTQALPEVFETLFRDAVQYREIVEDLPLGVLVHDGLTVCYVNREWLRLHAITGEPGNSEKLSAFLRAWLKPELRRDRYQGKGEAFISSRAAEINWHGKAVGVVYSSEQPATASVSAERQLPRPFVEKRRGHRRQRSQQPDAGQSSSVTDETLFNMLPNPLFIVSDWQPVYTNLAAKRLLGAETSLLNLISDRERALMQAHIEGGTLSQSALHFSCMIGVDQFAASVSVIDWGGQMAALISLQPIESESEQASQWHQTVGRLNDFNASAADFLWELDSGFSLSFFQPISLTGFDGKALLHQTIEEIASTADSGESAQAWQDVIAQLHQHQSVRDVELQWQRGESVSVLRLSAVPVFSADGGFNGYRGTGRDITRDHRRHSEVVYHASHDALTGLVNRREFESRCDFAVSSASDGQTSHALCFLDLDNFKTVNDTCGHLAGDELLRQLSELFSRQVRKSDVLARLGGDEFGVLVFNVGLNEAQRLANQIRAEVENFEFLWEGNRFTVGVSIGLVIVDSQWESRSALFGAADAACYAAKNQGRNRVSVHQRDESAEDIHVGEMPWVEIIQSALADNRLRLCMQEILALDDEQSGASRQVELLLRILTPENELLSPRAFLPAAERHGLAARVDSAVIEFALHWLTAQPHLLDSMHMCALNLSGRSFTDQQFSDQLASSLGSAALDVSKLCFEVSETATIANLTVATRFMRQIGMHGCQFSLDDFGSGLSSFSYLKNLPVNYIKIDGRFVRDILEDPTDFAMVKAINDVGQTLGKKTIAEFVENESVLDKLIDMGVNYAQGFHIGKPQVIDFP